jgi:hypothetical protein
MHDDVAGVDEGGMWKAREKVMITLNETSASPGETEAHCINTKITSKEQRTELSGHHPIPQRQKPMPPPSLVPIPNHNFDALQQRPDHQHIPMYLNRRCKMFPCKQFSPRIMV